MIAPTPFFTGKWGHLNRSEVHGSKNNGCVVESYRFYKYAIENDIL